MVCRSCYPTVRPNASIESGLIAFFASILKKVLNFGFSPQFQVNAPEYIFLISNFAGERRFASSVSKRLESLGALTHADRRATETRNLSQFNVDNKYGKKALDTIMEKVLARNATGSTAAEILQIKSFAEMREALLGVGIGFLHDQISSLTIPRFLNRILGLPVPLQNKLFDYFTDTFDSIIAEEKKHGRYDMGIQGK